MTARQVWEGTLIELNKVNAPSLLLEDFNYFFNKAINQYINKHYNIYDINQQSTDDLRVLKSSATLKPEKYNPAETDIAGLSELGPGLAKLFGASYEVNLPLDYLHMLNCVCIYKVKERYKCYNEGDTVWFSATRLTADVWSQVLNNFFLRPRPQYPYYYINNVNQSNDLPTNPMASNKPLDRTTVGTDTKQDYNITGSADKPVITSNMPRTIALNGITNTSLVEKEAGVRYGNTSNVRCEIRYGYDNTLFELIGIRIDYIKTPQLIRLTQEQVDLTRDTSQMMEFPDYVCQEIINELTMLVMENTANPRLQTNTQVSQSIATPAQQQTPSQAQARQQQQS